MKLTTRGRYAVTAMLDLALHQGEGPVCLSDVARRQSISLSYLEQLFRALRREGLVRSTRGPCGGYRLAREGGAISVARIIAAVDEPIDPTRCGGARNCQDAQSCLTHELWAELGEHIRSFLERTTLADLTQKEGVLAVARRQHGAGDGTPCVRIAVSGTG
ncbi:MAG TPA: Rrf2 family transcriptional regulator [Gammaproteobacteria bacterium]|nr:Rrf2 family transcriptional regulator [Gammaproteobacteria bacterium]